MDKQYYEQIVKRTFMDFQSNSTFLKNPLYIKRGKGVYLWDTNDKRYFDAIGGIFVASLGHCHPRLIEAMTKQMEILTLAPPLHSIAEISLQFIEKLGKMTPGNLNYIKSFSGGSESIEAALKYMRQYNKQMGRPDKMKCISNYLGYHGATLAALSAGGSNRKIKFEPQMPGFLKNFSPKQLRDDFSTWEETCRFCANLFEKIILSENEETVGAILLEPICNTAGIITPTQEYFEIIRRICDKYDIMLIFDEVLTGFCKTGDLFAAQTFHVTPDIICSGKGLSSGMIPLGSMMAREDLADAFDGDEEINFAHGHTYANFPLGNAVAIEVLNIMEEDKLWDRANEMNKIIMPRLEDLRKYEVIREIRGKGVLLGIELVEDVKTNRPFPEGNKLGSAMKKTALDNGIILRIDPDWFAIAPPLIATDEQIEEMCDKIELSLKQALEIVKKNKI
jgi:adenosylmethionine-8-amino-7-oxononanoate aminotransferase